jgi:Na+-transporting NADH:ubiquinone oxidoreductase subunit B
VSLRKILDNYEHHFQDGGRLQKFYPLFEAVDTFLYSPPP